MKKILSSFKPFHWAILATTIVGISFAAYYSINQTESSQKGINPEFAAYIAGYTSGDLSIESTISIRFVNEIVTEENIGKEIDADFLDFSPSVSGKAIWTDAYTLEYHPKEWLNPNENYTVELELDEIIKDLPEEFETFSFTFHTIKPDFSVSTTGINTEASNMKIVTLSGNLNTADVMKSENIEKLLTATQNGNTLPITWNHTNKNNSSFIVEKIARKENEESVLLQWDGNAFGIETKGESKIKIPALGDFSVLNVNVINSNEQYVELIFSDPLDEKQDLNGLITFNNHANLKFTIKNNRIFIYSEKKQIGSVTLKVHEGIKNVLGYKLKKGHTETITFEQLKPSVRFVGNGVIVPASDGLIFPFEAVNLKAIDVKIIQIFENNTVQFFQSNNLDGNSQLKRVGRPIKKISVPLNTNKLKNLNKWNRYTLDLAKLITPQIGAIYQVELSFRKSQSAYGCDNVVEEEDELTPLEEENWNSESYSDYDYDYYDYYYEDEDYDWKERENPCHSTYYSYQQPIKRNIIASNLGLMAKVGKTNEIFVISTDINTAKPQSGVKLEILDFQQQVCGKGETDGEGLSRIKTSQKPFLVIAKKDNDVNYLKVDDASSLSLSNFDVSGEEIQKGLKGFIYGERGVWRPGDTLFLGFILEDKNKTLPPNHPVIFELYNPSGKQIHKSVKTTSVNGFYTYQPIISEESPTGNWNVRVKIGGTVFQENIKIETIKPNRLKIKLDFGKEILTANDPYIEGNLNVKWLHGGEARGLRAEFEAILVKSTATFEKFKQYTFDDKSLNYSTEHISIFDGRLDQQGNAKVPVELTFTDNVPSLVNVFFKGKVYEEGGDFSVDQFNIPYYPYESYVGIKSPEGNNYGTIETDHDQYFNIVCITPKGNVVPNKKVEVELYKLDWRWWWDQSSNNISNYVGSSYNTPLKSEVLTLKDGRGNWKMRVNYPEWGRYYVRVKDLSSGHTTGQVIYMDWPDTYSKARRDLPSGETMLTFTADKESYKVGENIKLSIPGSNEARALISIENGSQVLETYWLDLVNGENAFNVKVNEKMAPNVFVHVTVIQPHKQTINDLPIRLYGIIPIKIDNPSSHLEPVITMPAELSPNKLVSIDVTEKNNKPMTFTLAVVDEGLLDITNFKTPNPWLKFNQHEALGVNTWDIYKYVLGAYGGEIEKLLAIGGDAELKVEENDKIRRFKPIVKFYGPYSIEGGKKNIQFKMPNYIGSVRTMIIAGQNHAYGFAEKATPVRQNLMVLATLPRVLSPGEKLKLPVNVFAYNDNIKNVKITVSVKGQAKVLETTKNITFSKKGDQMVDFDLEVLKQLGNAKFEIKAESGDQISSQEIEIEVRNPFPVVSKVQEKILQPGESWSVTLKKDGIKGSNKMSFEVSSIPSINALDRVNYLVRYPHGCVEQTSSAIFGSILIPSFTELSEEQKTTFEKMLNSSIEHLKKMQTSSGYFTYWPGSNYESEWSTSYAGHALIIAKKKGVSFSNSILSDWKSYQNKKANEWSKSNYYNSDLMQAYRLYTLALNNTPNKSAMNRMKESASIGVQATYLLAATYALSGQKNIGLDLIKNIEPKTSAYRELSYTYGSDYRDKSLLLISLIALDDKTNAMYLSKEIAQKLNNGSWLSTQETSMGLLAINSLLQGQTPDKSLAVTYTCNGKTDKIQSSKFIYQQAYKTDVFTDNKVTFTNTGKSPSYVVVCETGQPISEPANEIQNILNLDVSYQDKNGNAIDVSRIKQNTDIIVTVSVSNNGLRGKVEELALTTIFPSGWEIQNGRLDQVAAHFQGETGEYQDFRDDRIHTYFDLNTNEKKTFRFLVNTSYVGNYYLPGISCEAMYDKSIQAFRKGKSCEIYK